MLQGHNGTRRRPVNSVNRTETLRCKHVAMFNDKASSPAEGEGKASSHIFESKLKKEGRKEVMNPAAVLKDQHF